jgi:hypothetical protein
MAKHTHTFTYPWPNFRRCKCGLRQWYWECEKRWKKGASHELAYVHDDLRPSLFHGNVSRREYSYSDYVRDEKDPLRIKEVRRTYPSQLAFARERLALKKGAVRWLDANGKPKPSAGHYHLDGKTRENIKINGQTWTQHYVPTPPRGDAHANG